MSKHITADSLLTLEAYARARPQFRAQVMAHKRDRTLALGAHVTLIFEDELTVRYQVQEMLRIEKIFERDGIQQELDAYTPLVPDGSNLKATLMIEYPDPEERKERLQALRGIERTVYLGVDVGARIVPIADEDLARENEEKTSAVHFLRFEFSAQDIARLRQGAALTAGIDHAHYNVPAHPVPEATLRALIKDFDVPEPVCS